MVIHTEALLSGDVGTILFEWRCRNDSLLPLLPWLKVIKLLFIPYCFLCASTTKCSALCLFFPLQLPKEQHSLSCISKRPVIYPLWLAFVPLVPLVLPCTCAIILCFQQPLLQYEHEVNSWISQISLLPLYEYETFLRAPEQQQLIAFWNKNYREGEKICIAAKAALLVYAVSFNIKTRLASTNSLLNGNWPTTFLASTWNTTSIYQTDHSDYGRFLGQGNETKGQFYNIKILSAAKVRFYF